MTFTLSSIRRANERTRMISTKGNTLRIRMTFTEPGKTKRVRKNNSKDDQVQPINKQRKLSAQGATQTILLAEPRSTVNMREASRHLITLKSGGRSLTLRRLPRTIANSSTKTGCKGNRRWVKTNSRTSTLSKRLDTESRLIKRGELSVRKSMENINLGKILPFIQGTEVSVRPYTQNGTGFGKAQTTSRSTE